VAALHLSRLPVLPRRPNRLILQGKQKTYNSGYSLVVTHLTTNPPVRCLNRAERTGSLVFNVLWSYVIELASLGIYKASDDWEQWFELYYGSKRNILAMMGIKMSCTYITLLQGTGSLGMAAQRWCIIVLLFQKSALMSHLYIRSFGTLVNIVPTLSSSNLVPSLFDTLRKGAPPGRRVNMRL
jgi:hypothetical protein